MTGARVARQVANELGVCVIPGLAVGYMSAECQPRPLIFVAAAAIATIAPAGAQSTGNVVVQWYTSAVVQIAQRSKRDWVFRSANP